MLILALISVIPEHGDGENRENSDTLQEPECENARKEQERRHPRLIDIITHLSLMETVGLEIWQPLNRENQNE